MKIKTYFIVLLFFGILMSSCQKEELITQPLIEKQESTEVLANYSNTDIESIQNSKGKKAAQCTKINLFTEFITVSFSDFDNIETTLLNSGISLLAPGCNTYYHQNSSNFPGWTQKVKDAIEVQSIGDDDITFRINNLTHVCYWCFFNSFCNFHNSTIHVILGNGCVIGQFVLNVTSDQFIEIDLSPIINATCSAPC